MLLRRAAVLNDLDFRAGHRRFDSRFDLLQRFHFKKGGSTSQNIMERIAALPTPESHRVKDNAIHPERSSVDHRWVKHIRIRRRFQVVLSKLRHGELAWLVWLEKLGLICARQLLIVDLALQFHEGVKQRFRPGRATGDVNIDRDVTVDAFENVVTLLKWPA